jgi:hypothetical protein
MTEQDPTPPEAPAPARTTTPAAAPAESPKRFAVYDTTYLRFVGGTHADRKAATAVAKDRKLASGSYEIREV